MAIQNFSSEREIDPPANYQLLWGIGGNIVFVVGSFCNVMTLVIVYRLRSKAAAYQFVMALAASDIVINIQEQRNITLAITGEDVISFLSVFTCKVFHWLPYASVMTSSWLTAAISVCRAVIVTRPHMQCLQKPKVIRAIIVAIWVSIYALNSFYLTKTIILSKDGKMRCTYKTGSVLVVYREQRYWFRVLGCFILPFTTMIVSDVILIRQVFKSVKQVTAFGWHQRSNRQISVLVLAISLSFFVFNFPAFSCVIIHQYRKQLFSMEGVNKFHYIKHFFYFLSYCSSATDLFMYVLASREIRKKSEEMMREFCLRVTQILMGTTLSSTSGTATHSRTTTFPLSHATQRDGVIANNDVMNVRPSAMSNIRLSRTEPPNVKDVPNIGSSADTQADGALPGGGIENAVPPERADN